MSEITISTGHPDAGRVYAEALDRVTDERDALQTSLDAVTFNLDKTDKVVLALQQRLTVADKLVCERTASLLECGTRRKALEQRVDVLVGLVGEVLDAVGREPLDLDAVLRLRARMRAALKPAEVSDEPCEFCKGWGFRANSETGADEGCGACNGIGSTPSEDQP
ncbi:hypothetical protein AB3967_08520 [Pseudomonas rhodesiae]|uniref:hypothetical protein n=1 Tax=Pseudomonas rhodesiae TaxID=76760 RepID=UPI00161184A4